MGQWKLKRKLPWVLFACGCCCFYVSTEKVMIVFMPIQMVRKDIQRNLQNLFVNFSLSKRDAAATSSPVLISKLNLKLFIAKGRGPKSWDVFLWNSPAVAPFYYGVFLSLNLFRFILNIVLFYRLFLFGKRLVFVLMCLLLNMTQSLKHTTNSNSLLVGKSFYFLPPPFPFYLKREHLLCSWKN